MGLESVYKLTQQLSEPAWRAVETMIEGLPYFLWALAIILFGYLFSKLVAYVLHNALAKSPFETWFTKQGYSKSLGGMSGSHIISSFTKWYILALFLIEAFAVLQFGALSDLLYRVASWLPSAVIGVFIIFAGLIIADIVVSKMLHLKNLGWVARLAPIVKFVIVVFFIDIALSNAGVQIVLAQTTFIVLVSALAFALALVIGISFGYAFRNEASKIVKKIAK